MFKIIEISGDTLRLDAKDVNRMVSSACRRAGVYVEGVAVLPDKVMLVCGDNEQSRIFEYCFTALGRVDTSEIVAELRTRYDSSFRTVGAFALADGVWTLTEKSKTAGDKNNA